MVLGKKLSQESKQRQGRRAEEDALEDRSGYLAHPSWKI